MQNIDLEKDLNAELEKDLPNAKLKHAPFTKPVPAMAKATTLVKLDQTIEDLQTSIEEMQAMIRVVEEIKKRLV
jgi:hypothetical protein